MSLLSLLESTFFSLRQYGRLSFSQDGEDILLASFYERNRNYKGFFVDVGAHHPYSISNTAYFYRRGWKGINIEPTPDLFDSFLKKRKRDINLNYGIGNGETLTFYVFNKGNFNTFDSKLAEERVCSYSGELQIINTIEIKTHPLSEILDNYLPANTKIDLLTIDVEGLDYQVLLSNNWEKYIPEFIFVECEESLSDLSKDEIYLFLTQKNYKLVGRTKRTSLFHHN